MLKKFTAPERHHLFFVLSGFMLLSTVASTQVVVNPDGSETLGTLPMGNLPTPAASQASITVDFNDLAPEQVVSPDRYKTLGLRIEIGPSSTTSGVVEGSLTEVPCDGTRSIKTQPFT
jgi:hypothetical protein